MQCIFYAGFLFLHFHFGRCADFNQGHTAGQLGDALLQFLAVVVAGSVFDLLTNHGNATFDHVFLASAVDDDGVFLTHFDALGLAQFGQGAFFQRQANFFGNHGSTSQDGDVFQHGFAAIAKTRRLNSGGL